MPTHYTLALENYVQRSLDYYQQMIDANGLPYFNIFWTDPAEAAHDWPDFGDVTARQLQAVIMSRRMTGLSVAVGKVWYQHLLAYLDPDTGLLLRPQTTYSNGDGGVNFLGDQALTLYALVTAYCDAPTRALQQIISRHVTNLQAPVQTALTAGKSTTAAFGLKSLMVAARLLNLPVARNLAAQVIRHIFDTTPIFTTDHQFPAQAHVHSMLRILVGAADYALDAGDSALFDRIDACYRVFRSHTTRFGFLPEVLYRQGDIIACETCALMDYIGLAVTLANHGHPEYWGDVERTVRNHLIESQVTDLSWLRIDPNRVDTDQFSWRHLNQRMLGGYAGWSSPTQILAACEALPWGGPELRNKVRAFQNCCGGSGTHAFFIAWKNSARFELDTLTVNLHWDKLLPQAEIRGFQPYQGLLTIQLKTPARLRIRIPEFVTAHELQLESNRQPIPFTICGNFLSTGPRSTGEQIQIRYPLPVFTEEIKVGNPGFRQYGYRVVWKGDTVLKIEPLETTSPPGYSDFEKKLVDCFYGEAGPARLYQRAALNEPGTVALASLHPDDGSLDFWKIGS